MATSIIQLAPFIPSDTALAKSKLLDNTLQLNIDSAKLAGQLSPLSLAALERYMMVINSYYSNLIEGNATRPHEIRAAQRGDYDGDPVKRDLQLESTAHIAVQQWISEQSLDLDTIFSTDFILELHRRFYSLIPESPSATRVLHHAFVLGELKRAEAVDLCGMPERSARRLLSQLKTEGLLSETSSRSPLRWEIPEHAEAWYFPNLAPFS